MWMEKWIRDCSPADVAKKLTTLCDVTNAPAKGDCPCVGCAVVKVPRFEKAHASLVADYNQAKVEAFIDRNKLEGAMSDVNALSIQVDTLTKQLNAAQVAAAQATLDAAVAKTQAANSRQEAQDAQAKYNNLIPAHRAAVAELDRIKSVLASLV